MNLGNLAETDFHIVRMPKDLCLFKIDGLMLSGDSEFLPHLISEVGFDNINSFCQDVVVLDI